MMMLPSFPLPGMRDDSFEAAPAMYGESSPVNVIRRVKDSSRDVHDSVLVVKLSTLPHVSYEYVIGPAAFFEERGVVDHDAHKEARVRARLEAMPGRHPTPSGEAPSGRRIGDTLVRCSKIICAAPSAAIARVIARTTARADHTAAAVGVGRASARERVRIHARAIVEAMWQRGSWERGSSDRGRREQRKVKEHANSAG
eukprot:851175-Prymnesium_polylepis.1